jgi:hypothetical protein
LIDLSIDLTIFSTIVAPGKNSRSWRQHLYPETDTVDYTDDSFQLDVIIEDFNSIQPPILPIDKEYHIFIPCPSPSWFIAGKKTNQPI